MLPFTLIMLLREILSGYMRESAVMHFRCAPSLFHVCSSAGTRYFEMLRDHETPYQNRRHDRADEWPVTDELVKKTDRERQE